MRVLMIALVALVAFGLIGFLLAAAVLCETKAANRAAATRPGKVSTARPAHNLDRHLQLFRSGKHPSPAR
jgi:hypothetical protein